MGQHGHTVLDRQAGNPDVLPTVPSSMAFRIKICGYSTEKPACDAVNLQTGPSHESIQRPATCASFGSRSRSHDTVLHFGERHRGNEHGLIPGEAKDFLWGDLPS